MHLCGHCEALSSGDHLPFPGGCWLWKMTHLEVRGRLILPFTYCLLRFGGGGADILLLYFLLIINNILYSKLNIIPSWGCQLRSEKPSVNHSQLSRYLITGEPKLNCSVFLSFHLLSAARSPVGFKVHAS